MFLCFGDTVIDFGLTRCQRQIFSNAEYVIKHFLVSRRDSKYLNLQTLEFYNISSLIYLFLSKTELIVFSITLEVHYICLKIKK